VTVIVPVNAEVLENLSPDEAAAFAELLKCGRGAIEAVERRKKKSIKLSGLKVTMAVDYSIERSPYDA
jgi:hypothetical protein